MADLHIHSYLSRATSKNLNLEELYRVAQHKGITVVGTGDFTHPKWLAELGEKLVSAEPGLFKLKDELARPIDETIPAACRGPVRFLLSVEISNIYKRAGKVRKVHNLVYAPDLSVAGRIATRLGQLGNVTSDGRPILGLDSRDLLEVTLESSPDAYLVPAHVWTPWFSALGAESGFDAVNDCFVDLAEHIFAVETGLSSDPIMNWRLSSLDRFALVSSSDAHSPEKLGREANLFDTDLSYFALRDALKTRNGFLGTLEFFPEEGKYHLDGHRKCDIVLSADEGLACGRICSACKTPLTRGVYGRVAELADREEGRKPENAQPFSHMVQLCNVLAEVFEVGPGSKRVQSAAQKMLDKLGPELSILRDVPLEDIARESDGFIAEAVKRVRGAEVKVDPGYDGVYGVVRIFSEEDRRQLQSQGAFGFSLGKAPAERKRKAIPSSLDLKERDVPGQSTSGEDPREEPSVAPPTLTDGQAKAVHHVKGPLLIVAGPGTGKTRTLAYRIAELVNTRGVSPRSITAFSFTRKAARELAERVEGLLGDDGKAVSVTTFHAFGQKLLRTFPQAAGLPAAFVVLSERERETVLSEVLAEKGMPRRSMSALRAAIGLAKAGPPATAARGEPVRYALPAPLDVEMAEAFASYERRVAGRGAVDMDDLVVRAIALLAAHPEALAWAEERSEYLFVDEYQDINASQAALVGLLTARNHGQNLCAVGDPDQSIYAFRGSDPSFFARFELDYPDATTVALGDNFRSPSSVLDVATTMIATAPRRPARLLRAHRCEGGGTEWLELATPGDEASYIARAITKLVGGMQIETTTAGHKGASFGDIAVLFRLSSQAQRVAEALEAASIPYQRQAGAEPMTPEEVEALMLKMAALPEHGDVETFVGGLWALQSVEVQLAAEKVALLSLHAAKGLEFDHVFIVGCEEGILPLDAPGLSSDLDEERRLLYVGMTRAKERLVLTSVRDRQLWGKRLPGNPTPFLKDIMTPTPLVTSQRPKAPEQLSLW